MLFVGTPGAKILGPNKMSALVAHFVARLPIARIVIGIIPARIVFIGEWIGLAVGQVAVLVARIIEPVAHLANIAPAGRDILPIDAPVQRTIFGGIDGGWAERCKPYRCCGRVISASFRTPVRETRSRAEYAASR